MIIECGHPLLLHHLGKNHAIPDEIASKLIKNENKYFILSKAQTTSSSTLAMQILESKTFKTSLRKEPKLYLKQNARLRDLI